MKREIKFRGLRTDGKGWVYGYYIAYRVTGGGILYHHIKNPSDTFMVSVESVGQYTGLKDKYGVEIYEGDILKDSYDVLTVIIEFKGGCFVGSNGENYVNNRNWLSFEVIGNIHEPNPHSLT